METEDGRQARIRRIDISMAKQLSVAMQENARLKIELDKLKELHAWCPIDIAPEEIKLLVWGGGGVRFGYLDKLGCWRASHHGPIRGTPTMWRTIPVPDGATNAD